MDVDKNFYHFLFGNLKEREKAILGPIFQTNIFSVQNETRTIEFGHYQIY